jgi:hypothetical protein
LRVSCGFGSGLIGVVEAHLCIARYTTDKGAGEAGESVYGEKADLMDGLGAWTERIDQLGLANGLGQAESQSHSPKPWSWPLLARVASSRGGVGGGTGEDDSNKIREAAEQQKSGEGATFSMSLVGVLTERNQRRTGIGGDERDRLQGGFCAESVQEDRSPTISLNFVAEASI